MTIAIANDAFGGKVLCVHVSVGLLPTFDGEQLYEPGGPKFAIEVFGGNVTATLIPDAEAGPLFRTTNS
jgi:hypothetical protein